MKEEALGGMFSEIAQKDDQSTYVCFLFFLTFFCFRKSDKNPRASNVTSNYNVL